MTNFDDSRVTIVDNIKEIRLYSTDTDSHAILDVSVTVRPNGNVRYYFDDEIISECLDYGWPDHHVDDHQYDEIKKDFIVISVRYDYLLSNDRLF
jgi:hypothetical protein